MRNTLFVCLMMVLFVSAAFAGNIAIAPGGEYTLSQNPADGGSFSNNGNISFTLASLYDVNARNISALASGGLSIGTGSASSQIYYDFSVPSTPETDGNTVGAWVSYSVDWQGTQLILSTFVTNSAVNGELVLRDVTDSTNIRIESIHELDLKTHSYKFIRVGLDFNDSGLKLRTFPAVLKRGNTYRLTLRMTCTLFVISPSGTPSTCDYFGGSRGYTLNSLHVKVGLDEQEVLQRLNTLENHRHVYLTGIGVGHNNTEALSSTPVQPSKSTVTTSPPILIPEESAVPAEPKDRRKKPK